MAFLRCTGSAALLSAVASGARIAKRRVASETVKTQDCFSPYDGLSLLELAPCSLEEGAKVQSQVEAAGCSILGEPLDQIGCDAVEMVCSEKAAEMIQELKLAKIVSSDAGALWRGSSGTAQTFVEGFGIASDFYSAWRDLDAQTAHVEALVQASGGLATLETVGQSLEGRDMKIVRFRGAGYTPGGPRLVATFNLHAREWITGMSGVYAVEQLIAKLQADPDYLAGFEVVFMPMGNPDGFHYSTTTTRMHRKNMAPGTRCIGVDLNRNWDAHWAQGGSSSDPCQDVFHGPRPMSEPESNVIASVMEESPMSVFIDVHSYTQLIISSYAWTTANHPRRAEYRAIGGLIKEAIRQSGGNSWQEGPAAQVLYAASGGTIDYADDRGALGICFELRPGRFGGGGFAPPASQILPGAEECFAGLMAAIDYVKDPDATTPAPPGECPWHGCFWGCGGTDCEYCERCQR